MRRKQRVHALDVKKPTANDSAQVARSIVLQQPWANAIAEGAFPGIVKSTKTNIRGWVGILATGSFDQHAVADRPGEFATRAVVGAVEIVDCIRIDGNPFTFLRHEFGDEFAAFYPKHFALTGQYLWRFGACMKVNRPRPFAGAIPRVWATTPARLRGDFVLFEAR